MTDRIPLLIDTDPGVDDALALLMAFASPRHQLVGLCLSAGNVGLTNTVANALKLCEVAGVDIPVFPGAAGPLVHPAADAAFVHGRDGFGDVGWLPAATAPQDEHAALAMIRLSREYPGMLLVCLGPLTNLALAVRLDPGLPTRIGRLVVMGGAATGRGNTTLPVEFNIGFDPEAARIVFDVFTQIDLVDWEAVVRHALPHADVDHWLEAADPRAAFYAAISHHTRRWSAGRRGDRWPCADALAMAFALAPEDAESLASYWVGVEVGGAQTRGMTLVDWQGRSGHRPQVRLLQAYKLNRFAARVAAALGAGGD